MDTSDITPDVRAIRSLFDAWYRAMQDADVASLMLLVTPDVIVKPPGAPPISGKDALEQALTGFLETHTEIVDYDLQEVEVCGQLAFARIRESATILPSSEEGAVSVHGMHLSILRRQPDGEWRLARDISSLIDTAPNPYLITSLSPYSDSYCCCIR